MQIGSQLLWKFNEKGCLEITIHRFLSLIRLMAMASQSNFHLKVDPFRQVMPPKGATMALHNSRMRLSSVLQPLFLQLPHSSLSTLQFFKEHQGKQKASKICFPHHQKHADLKQVQALKTKKMARNQQVKRSGPISRLQCLLRSGRKG